MKADDFDKKFDDGEDVGTYLDLKSAKRPGLAIKRVNVDFPEWMISGLNEEAERLGVTRQALIKFWISTHLTDTRHGKSKVTSKTDMKTDRPGAIASGRFSFSRGILSAF